MIDSNQFRRCLGRYATGVTIVTCSDSQGGPCGITANSFSSVSLEPPLVLWNIAKVSHSLSAYLEARHFAINVLSAEQQSLSEHFAKSDHTLFAGVTYSRSAHDVPLLPDTLACLECSTSQIHEAGDHFIIVGEVETFRSTDQDPLLFYDGAYNRVSTEESS